MKTKTVSALLLALLALSSQLSCFAQGTAFTYQGRLNDGSAPANGTFDFTFSLFNIESGGTAVIGPLTNSAVAVSNGLFTVAVDFGAGVYNGDVLWIEMAVPPAGNRFYRLFKP